MRNHTRIRTERRARRATLGVEGLEVRRLLSVGPPASAASQASDWFASPIAIGHFLGTPGAGTTTIGTGTGIGPGADFGVDTPGASPAAQGPYTPSQIRHAYGFDQLSETGAGQTIAIVDAYDDPTIASDLAEFDQAYGLPDANLIKATPQGQPSYNSGWALEISLDVEWAHAIAPGATILLVEAASNSGTSLDNAVSYAISQGAEQVSMSWGGGEHGGETSTDSMFDQPGVTFLASTGDTGAEVSYPASSPYVTGVGGTSLQLDASGDRTSETAWSSGGGGASGVEGEPAFQAGFLGGSGRGTPDVSYDADPGTGFFVYDGGQLADVGGTSAGAPQWAGLVALVNQGRAALGESPLGTGQQYGTNSVLYSLAGGSSYTNPDGDFFDIVSGSNGNPATTGYDLATGLGSPVANNLVPDLIGPASQSIPAVSDAGFESPSVGPGNFQYFPTGSAWTFAVSAGIAADGSGFTSGNPDAPEGSQVAFLQGNGSASQSVAGWSSGTYQISFDAAQRGNYGGANDFEVLVDGSVVGTFDPSGTSYQSYTTAPFSVSAGSHMITFQGLDSAGGDNTAFIDEIQVVAS